MTHSIYFALRFKEIIKAVLEWHCSTFQNSKIIQRQDTALKAQFAGVPFVGINGGSASTPSFYFFRVICGRCSEIDEFWK